MSDDAPMTWVCRDGRTFDLKEMHGPHIQSARAVLRKWLKGEADPDMRAELRMWIRAFTQETKARKKEAAKCSSASKTRSTFSTRMKSGRRFGGSAKT